MGCSVSATINSTNLSATGASFIMEAPSEQISACHLGSEENLKRIVAQTIETTLEDSNSVFSRTLNHVMSTLN